jgi:hypothetical protein
VRRSYVPRVLTRKKTGRGKKISCGRCGKSIEPGSTYYKWSFRYGGTQYRCFLHPPKQSELTQSKMGTVYNEIEGAEQVIDGATDLEQITDAVKTVGDITQEVIDEYREAAENFGGQGPSAEAADELEDIKAESMETLQQCPR